MACMGKRLLTRLQLRIVVSPIQELGPLEHKSFDHLKKHLRAIIFESHLLSRVSDIRQFWLRSCADTVGDKNLSTFLFIRMHVRSIAPINAGESIFEEVEHALATC